MAEPLERETRLFEAHLETWRREHLGEVVLLKGDEVVGFFRTLEEAFAEGTRRFGLEPFMVRQVEPQVMVNVSFFGQLDLAMPNRLDRRREEALARKASREPMVLRFDFDPVVLARLGPIITTDVGIADIQRSAMLLAGQPIPPPVRARLLLDTGATTSFVRHDIAEEAGLKLIAKDKPIFGVGVDTTGRRYYGRISLMFQSRRIPDVKHALYFDTEIVSGALQSKHIDGLIGRDILRNFEISFHGVSGKVCMRYLHKAERLPPL